MLSECSLIISMTGRQQQEDDGERLIFHFSRLVSVGEMQRLLVKYCILMFFTVCYNS